MSSLRVRGFAAIAASLSLLAVPAVGVAHGQDADPPDGRHITSATPLLPSSTQTLGRAPSSRLVQTDPELLDRRDATRIPVVIKLDYDAIAAYSGGAAGAPATSPAVTGKSLTTADATTGPYARQIARKEAAIVQDLRAAVPAAKVGRKLRVVYGGVAATVPANEVAALLEVPGVVAVQADKANKPLTDSSTAFIGAPPVWATEGGRALAGKGVLFGDLDSGVWPEHPSFAANPALGPAPSRPGGGAIECDFGDNPLTPAVDVFPCNNKLVGGRVLLDSYLASHPADLFTDSARDPDGHGTHTSSTAAGDVVDHATISGHDFGTLSGVAPGAQIVEYKVCADDCLSSDSAAAVEAAILDGVDVINFSIGGGYEAVPDPTEVAFLDAYAAGVFVATSAGNEGPGGGTVQHWFPWTTTVAASTQAREFDATISLTSADGATTSFTGASIGAPIADPHPVVLASEVAGTDPGCNDAPANDSVFEGMIVACPRDGIGARVRKSYNVMLGGGAGMVLYEDGLQVTGSDDHYVPTVHIGDGPGLLAFFAAHDDITGTLTPFNAQGPGDVMARFSSVGPGGLVLKPDVTAPGVEIVAGGSPVFDDPELGPSGQYFRTAGGTSMSSPHVAGAAILVRVAHPDWSAGQIKSALMTTAVTAVTQPDGTTPATPFNRGAGRIDISKAVAPGLTIAETADRFAASATDPATAIDLNLPSVNAPTMPGRVTTERTVRNVGAGRATYDIRSSSPPGTSITVSPKHFTIAAGAQRKLTITLAADPGVTGQQFGTIDLTAHGRNPLHLPVAFVPQQGAVTLDTSCTPDEVVLGAVATCTVTATNQGTVSAGLSMTTKVDKHLGFTSASPGHHSARAATLSTTLAGRVLGAPSLEEYVPLGDGYLPLSEFDIPFTPIGDEQIFNFTTPTFWFNGVPYDELAIDSNGYLLPKLGTATDNNPQSQDLPDATPPNNVLAPFWADLTGKGTALPDPAGMGVATLTNNDTGDSWIVVELQVNSFGTDDLHVFQVWIGINGVQDITFAYDPDHHTLAGLDLSPAWGLTVGAENEDGSGGDQLDATPDDDTLPTTDLRVTSPPPAPSSFVTQTIGVRGKAAGTWFVRSELVTPVVRGVTVAQDAVMVKKKGKK